MGALAGYGSYRHDETTALLSRHPMSRARTGGERIVVLGRCYTVGGALSNNSQVRNSPPRGQTTLKRGRNNLIDGPPYKLPPEAK